MRIYKIAEDSTMVMQRALSYMYSGQNGYLGEMISEAFENANYTNLDKAYNDVQRLVSAFGNQNISDVFNSLKILNDFTNSNVDLQTIQDQLEDMSQVAKSFNALDSGTKNMLMQAMMGGQDVDSVVSQYTSRRTGTY